MSFVAIPGLIGPMLGPIAGGLLVGYFHWRVIFFVNLPIGLLGLYLVWRHLPDYREEHCHPLDGIGLILFGAGIALLSYVLEVFGDHTSFNVPLADSMGEGGVRQTMNPSPSSHAERKTGPPIMCILHDREGQAVN
jgi:MFS family permease